MKAFKLDGDGDGANDQAHRDHDGDGDLDLDVTVVTDLEALSVEIDVESGDGRGHEGHEGSRIIGAAAEEMSSEGARVSIGGHSFVSRSPQRRRSTLHLDGPLAAPGDHVATPSAGPGRALVGGGGDAAAGLANVPNRRLSGNGALVRHASMGSIL